ncbi:helix-turn-helix domain-containing protein [Tenacibaculum aiptasiae]|uniref:helix-turn-helix domain-containing protein n=1 Tax=Tenacibaculum aiptasiae TaxID=426481 RepID=UPI003B59D1A2
MFQEILIQKIKEGLAERDSLNSEIATALDISYDAAHRRTSLKSKFTLEESVLLARYFNLSLDSLFGMSKKNFVSIQKTKQITNEKELQYYFESSYQSLLPLLNVDKSEVYYSAKDIPIFYTLTSSVLSNFKFYVWLKLLDKSFRNKSFDSYHPSLSTLQSAKRLGDLYRDLSITEIWDTTTINSTLKQIHFYYKAGQLSGETAIKICKDLKQLLNDISLKVVSKKKSFKLYYNELLLMNNNVLVTTSKQQKLFVPSSMLSYFSTSDKQTCLEAKKYFNKQLYHSKLLNTAGEKEQNVFYYKMMEKVKALQKLIEAENVLDFE